MDSGIIMLLATVSAAIIWRLLGRTRLQIGWRILVTVIVALLTTSILFWVGAYVSILLFQLMD